MPRAPPCLLLVLMVLARSVGGFVRPVLRAAAPRSCSRLFSAVSASQGDGYGGDGVTLQCDAAAGGGAAASLIWCHGLGDTAMGWYQTVGAMLPAIQRGAGGGAVRALLPTAPTRPISLNGGMAMPGWSDVYGLSPEDDEDREGFDGGAARLNALIDGEIARGVDGQPLGLHERGVRHVVEALGPTVDVEIVGHPLLAAADLAQLAVLVDAPLERVALLAEHLVEAHAVAVALGVGEHAVAVEEHRHVGHHDRRRARRRAHRPQRRRQREAEAGGGEAEHEEDLCLWCGVGACSSRLA